MKIDVTAIQAIAGDLRQSGDTVLGHAETVKSAAAGVDSGTAGRAYREWGDRLAQGCAGVAGVLAAYGGSVVNGGSALGTAASAYETRDEHNAGRISRQENTL